MFLQQRLPYERVQARKKSTNTKMDSTPLKSLTDPSPHLDTFLVCFKLLLAFQRLAPVQELFTVPENARNLSKPQCLIRVGYQTALRNQARRDRECASRFRMQDTKQYHFWKHVS